MVNIIANVKFDLTYYGDAVQYNSHGIMDIPQNYYRDKNLWNYFILDNFHVSSWCHLTKKSV